MIGFGIPKNATTEKHLLFLLLLAMTKNPSVRAGKSSEGCMALWQVYVAVTLALLVQGFQVNQELWKLLTTQLFPRQVSI